MASNKEIALGPLVLDITGPELDAADRKRLRHPLVGGVILFARNYISPTQLLRLTTEIHAIRSPSLVIGVDHEGGRVQRFREGFTAIPAMRQLGRAWDVDPRQGRLLAQAAGFVLAAELRAYGLDLSFAPVLDVDHGNSSVIGDRALHSDPHTVAELARLLVQGFREAGMSAVGKHFPGHGHVRADSHLEVPVDDRPYADIERSDLVPFRRLIASGLGGIMPAHVVYPHVDERPAGFSRIWLTRILREQLGFQGIVFSDDLSMEGASSAGDMTGRARSALDAGCDMILVCNSPLLVDELFETLEYSMPALTLARLARMHGRPQAKSMAALREDAAYVRAVHALGGIVGVSGDLPLNE